MLQSVKSAEERWMDRVGVSPVPPTPSVFPADVVAIIYQPARSAMTSGKARTQQWKLRFEPSSPQFIEPLMGWTGSDDTLSQVELTFPSAEAAVAYARRQGLRYVLHGDKDADANVRQIGHVNRANSSQLPSTPRPRRLEWIEQTLGPDVIRNGIPAGSGPSARYASPRDVLRDPALSESQKADALRRWALDEYRSELALFKGDAVPHPSRLDEVVDALLDLVESNLHLVAGHASKSVR
jgi:hypothetical protein